MTLQGQDSEDPFDWVDNIESNLFASVFDAGVQPLVGWLTFWTGGESDPYYQQFQTLTTELTDITTAITQGFAQTKQWIMGATLSTPITDSESASLFSAYPPYSTVASDLELINNILAGIDPPFIGPLTPYIPTLVQSAAPRFYSDQGGNLRGPFEYFKHAQVALLNMLVELYHQGYGWISQNLWPPVPCNYANVAAALSTYHKNIQQQRSLYPFPTSSIGYHGQPPGLGVNQVVADLAAPGESGLIAWGYQNARHPDNMPPGAPGITP